MQLVPTRPKLYYLLALFIFPIQISLAEYWSRNIARKIQVSTNIYVHFAVNSCPTACLYYINIYIIRQDLFPNMYILPKLYTYNFKIKEEPPKSCSGSSLNYVILFVFLGFVFSVSFFSVLLPLSSSIFFILFSRRFRSSSRANAICCSFFMRSISSRS